MVKVEQFLKGREVATQLNQLFISSKKIRIAVAFIKEKGYDEIENSLKTALEKGIDIDFAIGASPAFRITDAAVLERLKNLENKYNKLKLKYSPESYFHPKLFIFQKEEKITIILGSSNLTAGGIGSNIEANIMISGEKGEKIINQIEKFFEAEILSLTFPLTTEFIENYKEYCNQFEEITKKLKVSHWKKPKSPLKTNWSTYPNPYHPLTKEQESELKKEIAAISIEDWNPIYTIDFANKYNTNSHSIRGYKAHVHYPRN